MKTNEFKLNIVEVADGHQVEFFIANYNHTGYLHIDISGERFAQINTHEPGVFTIVLNNKLYEMLSLSQVTVLIDYIEKFANTPLEKRVEEKEYYIKLIGTAGWCDCIAYNEKENHYFMSPSYEYLGYKTKFTLKQIKEYGLPNFADSDLFELVEVE